jgi:hypothetical protein
VLYQVFVSISVLTNSMVKNVFQAVAPYSAGEGISCYET